jgi:uncharacterized protein YndB with AHSA1/START domain
MMITIDAIVEASIEKTWRAYTMPDHITRWNFASPDWQCPRAENDLRVGGRYFARMEAKDGSFGFDLEAVYTEVAAHQALAYNLADGRHVRTTFEARNGTTSVTTVFDAETQNPIEMQRDGWQAILNNFAKYAKGAFA